MKVFVADKIDVVEASIGREWECFDAPMIGKQVIGLGSSHIEF